MRKRSTTRALDMLQQSVGVNHPLYAQVMQNLAVAMREQQKYEEAESLCKKAVETFQQAFGDDHPSVAMAKSNLSKIYCAEKKYRGSRTTRPILLRIVQEGFRCGPSASCYLHVKSGGGLYR